MGPPDSVAWLRKHDDTGQPAFIPDGVGLRYYPETLQDVIDIVAEADREGQPARACGSHWALSEAVADPGYSGRIIETHGLNRTLYDVIPDALSDAARAELLQQPAPIAGEWDENVYSLYHVEAGIRLYDLYSRLDRQDPAWPMPTDSLGAAALAGAWALPTMGGAGGQTIVGATATSTHGGDQARPPIADAIQAVHLVGTGGSQYWIERTTFSDRAGGPMSDPDRLRGALGAIEVIQDDDALDAAIVGVGRLGVVYSVVLRVVRQFGLRVVRRRQEWDAIQQELANPGSSLYGERFLQVVVNPFPRLNEAKHSCWVTQNTAIPIPDPLPPSWRGRIQRAGPGRAGVNPPIGTSPSDIYNIVCASRINFEPVFGSALALLRDVAPLARALPFVGIRVDKDIEAVIDELASIDKSQTDSLGDFIANVANFLVTEGHGWLLPAIVEALMQFGQSEIKPDSPVEDFSYAVLDGYNYTDVDCITDVDSIEVAFDASGDLPVRFINESLFVRSRELVDGTLTGTPMAFGGYASMRFTGRTRALIGIQQWQRTCVIEIAGPKRASGIEPLLDKIEEDAKGMGGTVHWGQHNSLRRQEVEAVYSGIQRWRAVLARLTATGRPDLFSTAYSRRAGLEI